MLQFRGLGGFGALSPEIPVSSTNLGTRTTFIPGAPESGSTAEPSSALLADTPYTQNTVIASVLNIPGISPTATGGTVASTEPPAAVNLSADLPVLGGRTALPGDTMDVSNTSADPNEALNLRREINLGRRGQILPNLEAQIRDAEAQKRGTQAQANALVGDYTMGERFGQAARWAFLPTGAGVLMSTMGKGKLKPVGLALIAGGLGLGIYKFIKLGRAHSNEET